MALLFIDGFEGNDFSTKWNAGGQSTDTGTVRFAFTGSRSLFFAGGSNAQKAIPATAQVTVGAAFNFSGFGSYILSLYSNSGAAQQITLGTTTNTGILTVWRGGYGGTLLATGTTSLLPNVWYYIELQATIDPSAGTVAVRLNGATTDELSFSGNTQEVSGYTTTDWVVLNAGVGVSYGGRVDDVYMADGLGGNNDSFLGDCRVWPMIPTAAGASTMLTPNPGTNANWQNVDSLAVQSTDYNDSATSGDWDAYTLSGLPATVAAVLGVQVNGYMWKSDANVAGAYNVLYTGSTKYLGAARSLSTTPVTYSDMYDTDPATSAAWTVADAGAVQTGMQVE